MQNIHRRTTLEWAAEDKPGYGLYSDMNMSQQCTLAVMNCLLGFIRKSVASRLRKVIIPLCGALLKPHWSTMSSFGSPGTRAVLANWGKSSRGPPSWPGLEHTMCKERLRELGLLSLEKVKGSP